MLNGTKILEPYIFSIKNCRGTVIVKNIVILDPNCSQVLEDDPRSEVVRLEMQCVKIVSNVTHQEAEDTCRTWNMSLWTGHNKSSKEVTLFTFKDCL